MIPVYRTPAAGLGAAALAPIRSRSSSLTLSVLARIFLTNQVVARFAACLSAERAGSLNAELRERLHNTAHAAWLLQRAWREFGMWVLGQRRPHQFK